MNVDRLKELAGLAAEEFKKNTTNPLFDVRKVHEVNDNVLLEARGSCGGKTKEQQEKGLDYKYDGTKAEDIGDLVDKMLKSYGKMITLRMDIIASQLNSKDPEQRKEAVDMLEKEMDNLENLVKNVKSKVS